MRIDLTERKRIERKGAEWARLSLLPAAVAVATVAGTVAGTVATVADAFHPQANWRPF